MSATQTPVAGERGEARPPAAGHDVMTEGEFAAAVRRDGNVDNTGLVDWDGARCEDCRTPVPDGARLCGECGS